MEYPSFLSFYDRLHPAGLPQISGNDTISIPYEMKNTNKTRLELDLRSEKSREQTGPRKRLRKTLATGTLLDEASDRIRVMAEKILSGKDMHHAVSGIQQAYIPLIPTFLPDSGVICT